MRTKTLFRILLVIILVAFVGLLVWYFVFRNNSSSEYRIKSLIRGDLVITQVEDYSQSRLNLYGNNTFSIEIYDQDGQTFCATGTYEKKTDYYLFTYIQCFAKIDDDMVTNPEVPEFLDIYGGTGSTYRETIVKYSIKNGQLQFIDHLGLIYYFGH